jgi:hypothetical protein
MAAYYVPNKQVSSDKVYFPLLFYDGLPITSSGFGTIYRYGPFFYAADTAGIAGDYVRPEFRSSYVVGGVPIITNIMDKNPEFEIFIRTNLIGDVTIDLACGTFEDLDVTTPVSGKHFGVIIDAGALYTSSGDGTTGSVLNQNQTLSSGTNYRLKVKLVSGSRVETYLNGTQLTNKTNNLPSGDGAYAIFFKLRFTNNVAATGREIWAAAGYFACDY